MWKSAEKTARLKSWASTAAPCARVCVNSTSENHKFLSHQTSPNVHVVSRRRRAEQMIFSKLLRCRRQENIDYYFNPPLSFLPKIPKMPKKSHIWPLVKYDIFCLPINDIIVKAFFIKLFIKIKKMGYVMLSAKNLAQRMQILKSRIWEWARYPAKGLHL